MQQRLRTMQLERNIEILYQPNWKHKKVGGLRSGFRYILVPGALRISAVRQGG